MQDDRIDALQMACHYWINQLGKDDELAMKQRKEDLLDAELAKDWGTSKDNSWITLQ